MPPADRALYNAMRFTAMRKVPFPNMYMRLLNFSEATRPATAKLQVAPKMTKHEIKEYLTKIYDVNVTKVNTANFLGKWRRFYGKRKVISYKERNFKVAYVFYDPTISASMKAKKIEEAAKAAAKSKEEPL